MESTDLNEGEFINSNLSVSYYLRACIFHLLINLKHLSLYPSTGQAIILFWKFYSILLSVISHILFPQLVFDLDFVESLLNKAYESSAMFYNIHDVVIAAEGFAWPPEEELYLNELYGEEENRGSRFCW